MRLSDFTTELEALNRAYRDSVDTNELYAMRRVHDVITIWWDALGEDYRFMEDYIEFVLQDIDEVRDHRVTLENLDQAIRQDDSSGIEIWCEKLVGTLKVYAAKVQKLTMERARTAGSNVDVPQQSEYSTRLEHRAVSLLISRIENADASQQLRVATKEARLAATDAQAAAESARTAAGVASGSTLTTRFNALANRHFWAATAFRILTVVGVIVGLSVAFALPLGGTTAAADNTPGNAILRVSLLAGVLGLATYFGRQAAYHRDVSTWARTIKEQLLTFDGYMEPVSDHNLRDQMRAAFAGRVFGPSPESSKEDAGVTLSSPVLSELAAAFAKAGAKP